MKDRRVLIDLRHGAKRSPIPEGAVVIRQKDLATKTKAQSYQDYLSLKLAMFTLDEWPMPLTVFRPREAETGSHQGTALAYAMLTVRHVCMSSSK